MGFVVFSLGKLGVVPGAVQVCCYGVAVLLGAAVHYSIMFSLATLSFWIVRAQGLIYGYFNLVNISRYPAEVFGGVFRWIFTWLIPVIVVANFPARILVAPSAQPVGLMLELLGVSRCWRWASAGCSGCSRCGGIPAPVRDGIPAVDSPTEEKISCLDLARAGKCQ